MDVERSTSSCKESLILELDSGSSGSISGSDSTNLIIGFVDFFSVPGTEVPEASS